jgi:hypothetical protein
LADCYGVNNHHNLNNQLVELAPHGSSDPLFGEAQFDLVLAQEPPGGLAEGANADIVCFVMLVGFQVDFVICREGHKADLIEPLCIAD